MTAAVTTIFLSQMPWRIDPCRKCRILSERGTPAIGLCLYDIGFKNVCQETIGLFSKVPGSRDRRGLPCGRASRSPSILLASAPGIVYNIFQHDAARRLPGAAPQGGMTLPGIELTSLSEIEYSRLSSQEMTPDMAAKYLWSGEIVLRTFRDTLREFYPHPDLLPRLSAAFQADDRLGKPESISKTLRNWISGRSQPTSREDIFHIAFALSLSEAQAGYLLGLCTDYAIHYRDGREAVYAWFLRTGRSYGEARDFFQTLPPAPRLNSLPEGGGDHLTRDMQNEFLRVQTVDDLRACYLRNLERFGALHLRAYTYFSKYLKQLVKPASPLDGLQEPDYSMEAVMAQYLSLKMPSGKDRSGYSAVQKLIKRN